LPKGFQTAEFLEEHGLIDMIIHRKKMRETIGQLLGYFSSAS
jgi:acetyl-CoA carboxylase carboxyl transferase subunit beta